MSDEAVRAQYEALPYPPRDPREEAKRLIEGSPSHLGELNHHVFGGRLDLGAPFRALIAGGGTGDGAIMLAQHLHDAGARQAEIVHLDWSRASRAVGEARAAVRALTNLRFVTASLLDLPTLGLGAFDYIDCCGVLHHLDDPEAGLAALVGALRPRGGMGLMLYGRLGRTGVYPVQAMNRALVGNGDDLAQRLALARRLLAQLPATNWFKRTPWLEDHATMGDAGLHDLLMHARDRAYDVREIEDLAARQGLRLIGFLPSARYEPANYLSDATLLGRLGALSPIERAAFAENLAGNMSSHPFYVVRADNPVAPASMDDRDIAACVPALRGLEAAALQRTLQQRGALSATIDGSQFRFALPALAPAIAGLIDARRDWSAIHGELRQRRADLDWPSFLAAATPLARALIGLGRLTLAWPRR